MSGLALFALMVVAAVVLLVVSLRDRVDVGDEPLARSHPRLRLLAKVSRKRPPMGTLPIEQERAGFDRMIVEMRSVAQAPPAVKSARDAQVPTAAGDVPVRIYTPEGAVGALPVVMHFHGGAFRVGGLDSYDGMCRILCQATGCIVVAVDYRLAPEHPFPAGLDDCYAATQWASEHAAEFGGHPGRVALYGDSAGGNMVASVAIMARDRGGPHIVAQVLIYPVTTMATDQSSMTTFATGYFLEKPSIDVMVRDYAPPESHQFNPLASPLSASDLGRLPPALVITAGFDPLRDQGYDYVRRLREAGVMVTHRNHRAMIHGFAFMTALLADARDCRDESGRFLRNAFGR